MKDVKKLAQEWWADNHPLDNVELARKHFPNVHYSDINNQTARVRHVVHKTKKDYNRKDFNKIKIMFDSF